MRYFFFIWINAYLVSSLTPLWTRSLEGSNWWPWLRELGAKPHLKRFLKLNAQINHAVATYANIELNRPQRRLDVEDAIAVSLKFAPSLRELDLAYVFGHLDHAVLRSLLFFLPLLVKARIVLPDDGRSTRHLALAAES